MNCVNATENYNEGYEHALNELEKWIDERVCYICNLKPGQNRKPILREYIRIVSKIKELKNEGCLG